jgi:hypothetical protein
MRTIKMDPPTWQYAVEIYILAIENGTAEGKEAAKAEIRRMARILDDQAKNPGDGK